MTTLLTTDSETEATGTAAIAVVQLSEPEFFEDVPPGQSKVVKDFEGKPNAHRHEIFDWKPKDLRLYCMSDQCIGYRTFRPFGERQVNRNLMTKVYLTYICRNCETSQKTYAVSIKPLGANSFEVFKYGELPQFGPPNPPKVLALMGGERDAYLKGRRCENQGLGIAAFAYYRRVVENQKARIIGEILKVAEKLNADPELIEDLKAAKLETRFTEAIGRIKHGLPPVLLIDGHNPLTLLHSALSEGLHGNSDEDCLELATSIRVVLTELVERMATAVKEEAVLTSAVQRLLKANAKR